MFLGMPLRFLAGTVILASLIIVPQLLVAFGIENEITAFLMMPLVVMCIFVVVFCMYAAPIVLNPARFMIMVPLIVIFAAILTYGLYM